MNSSKRMVAALALGLSAVSGAQAQELHYLGRDASGAKGRVEWGDQQYEVEKGSVLAGKGTVTELTDSHVILRRVLTEAEQEAVQSRGGPVYQIEEIVVPRGIILVPPKEKGQD